MPAATATDLTSNIKVGPCSATMCSQWSCPPGCVFKGNGCYAESGPMGIHTRRLNTAGEGMAPDALADEEAAAIRTKVSGRFDLRIHVVGDCTTDYAAQTVSTAACEVLRKGKIAWSYTHAWRDVSRASWGSVSVLASVEKMTDIQIANEKGYAAAIVVDSFPSDKLYEVDGHKILPCVNQTRGVQCVDCRLCLNADRLHKAGITIAFSAHGSSRKRVLKVLN